MQGTTKWHETMRIWNTFSIVNVTFHFVQQIYNQKLKALTPLPHFMYEKQTEAESDDKLRIKLCLRREKAGRCFSQCLDSKSKVSKTCSVTGAK